MMPLPDFDSDGDLPQGLHKATLADVTIRFGKGSDARQRATAVLLRIHELVLATGKLERLVIFGSYVTAKVDPRDVDIVLVMKDDFSMDQIDDETRAIFDHQRAQAELGASVFWLCPSILLRESLESFLRGWGIKRDLSARGIVDVEVIS